MRSLFEIFLDVGSMRLVGLLQTAQKVSICQAWGAFTLSRGRLNRADIRSSKRAVRSFNN